jgi:hypothetical protein
MTINDLRGYENNTKTHTQKQIEDLANSIKQFGFNVPVIIDSGNNIVAGHARVEAAKLLGLTEVRVNQPRAKKGEAFIPAILVDDLTEEEIKAYRIIDNRTNESMWNAEVLKIELGEIKSLDLGQFGFSEIELNTLINQSAKDFEIAHKIQDNEFGAYTADLLQNNKNNTQIPDAQYQGIITDKRFPLIFWFDEEQKMLEVKEVFKDGAGVSTQKLLEMIGL